MYKLGQFTRISMKFTWKLSTVCVIWELFEGHSEVKMFKINSEYKPAGDQPQAIKKLVEGINKGEKFQTLLGVTGSR